MADPNFKPKDPDQDKRSAAFALCTWLDQQGRLRETSDGVKISMEKAELLFEGPFRVVLPITGARRQIVEKADGDEELQLWLHIEASGPERDLDGDRFSETGLAKMVEYATKDELPLLDGHYRDLMAAMLGTISHPYLTEQKHFAFEALLNNSNPFAVQLFNDVLSGKRHGASIAGIVHDAEIEEYGEDGNFGRIFNDVELIEVSRTSWPSYRDSFITLLANKVGKLPQGEFDQIVQRRKEVISLMNKTCCGEDSNMKDTVVKTKDDSVEIWGENEAGEMVLKITAPHGWDKKFKVSNQPWSSVTDRSKPCQFAIIKTLEDGGFSKSKSGYPHHLPSCDTIVRQGVFNAAVRLVQAMKSEVEGLEIPPITSIVMETVGLEELEAYGEKASRFSTAELKYAARHILKHYRRDLEVEPPESLVAIAKTYEDEQQEIVDLVKNLVRLISTYKSGETEVMEMENTETPAAVEETPLEEASAEMASEEETLEQEAETVTETGTETETVEEVETVEQSEVAGETQKLQKLDGTLGENVDSRMLRRKFGVLTYTMQEMVEDAVRQRKVDEAHAVIDDFAKMGKEVVSNLVSTGDSAIAGSFLDVFEEAIEMATGRLSKSRVNRIDTAVESFIKQGLELREVLKNVDAIDDSGAVAATEKAEQAEETVSELAKKTNALMEESRKRSEELRKMAEALANPEREEIARAVDETEETIEISPENKYEFVKAKWLKGMERK